MTVTSGLEYHFLGEPFFNTSAKTSIDLETLDYHFLGDPFSAIVTEIQPIDPTTVLINNATVTAIPKTNSTLKTVSLKPSSDTSLGSWTDESEGTTNIYLSIDETIPNDTDYVQSPDLPDTNTYKFKLSTQSDPGVSTNHKIIYRASKTQNEATFYITVRLLQDTTLIAEWTDEVFETVSVIEHDLTEVQAGNITNYSDLYIELEGEQ